MPNKQRDGFGFAIGLCRALFVVACLAVALITAEVFLTKGHLLAETELANSCAQCGASMILVSQKDGRLSE